MKLFAIITISLSLAIGTIMLTSVKAEVSNNNNHGTIKSHDAALEEAAAN